MLKGKIKVKDSTRNIIRLTSLFIPILILLFEVFFNEPLVNNPYHEIPVSVVLYPWILLGLIIYLFPAKDKLGSILRLTAFHTFAAIYILFITGFYLPFITIGWVLLLLISYIYLGKQGLVLNLSILLLVVGFDIASYYSDTDRILMDIVALGSILGVGIILIVLNRIQQKDSSDLEISRAKELFQRDQINTLINSISDAVIGISNSGSIEVYNAATIGLIDTNANLVGSPINEVLKLTDINGSEYNLLESANQTPRINSRDDIVLKTANAEDIRLEITTSPIRRSYSHSEGDILDGFVIILRDITKAKSLEEEKDEFISVVSHELRTPITIVEGTLSNLKLMIEKGINDQSQLQKSLTDAHNQVLFLSKMINDLSTLSRAERGMGDDIESIDINELINSLYHEYQPEAEKKNIKFNIDVMANTNKVIASHLYLRELLQNLITNAIKYTNEGSILLRVKEVDGHILFEVQDTGIGISKSDQDKIFVKFYRSEDYRTRETGGTGLGLYVAAKLARKLNTGIKLTSRLNHGSTFSFLMATAPPDKLILNSMAQDEGMVKLDALSK